MARSRDLGVLFGIVTLGYAVNFLSVKGCVTSKTPHIQVYDFILIEAKKEYSYYSLDGKN